MDRDFIPCINEGIKKNKKVIITLGCSFVEGQGALDQKIWDNYFKSGMNVFSHYWSFTPKEIQEITSEFPYISVSPHDPNKLHFKRHEVNNSFGNVLCREYFNEEYTCINLGRSGNGNKAAIKELYYYPDILWDEIQDIIVIFCPSGPERYDFINDECFAVNEHPRWKTFWPDYNDALKHLKKPEKNFSQGLAECVASERGITLEQIANIQELLTWCKYKKAKLIVVPAFTRCYTREKFIENISCDVVRDKNSRIIHSDLNLKNGNIDKNEVEKIADMWPWENMFYPEGYPSFVDLTMAQEKTIDWENGPTFYYWQWNGPSSTPDKWLTPCSHPSAKAHALFAKILYNHIKDNLCI